VSTDKYIEAGISLELGGIIYRLSQKYDKPLDETAKLVYSSEAYAKLATPESLLYKMDLLQLVSFFESTMIAEGLLGNLPASRHPPVS
jgi:hypothetical protein